MQGLSATIVWLAIGGVWGTTWMVIRVGLEDLPPLTFAAIRTMLAGGTLVTIAILTQRARRPRGRECGFWLAVGIPQLGFTYALIFWAEQTVSSGMTAMLFATFPAFTAVAAHLLLPAERFTWRKGSGLALAMVAVAVLVNPARGDLAAPPLGIVAILAAAISASVASVLVRRHGRTTSTLWLTAIQVLAGAGFLCVLALVFERGAEARFSTRAVLAILYLAYPVTVGCYLGLFWLLKRVDATLVSMGVILETAVGVFAGSWILGEVLELRVWFGLGLVAASVAVLALPGHVWRRPPADPVLP